MEELDIEDKEMAKAKANLERVTFTVPKAKKIVHPHSGSILATDETITELDIEFKQKCVNEFQAFIGRQSSEQQTLKKQNIAELLQLCGYNWPIDLLQKASDKYLTDEMESIGEKEFCIFLAKFQAPPYYYGQRLRKCAGRGLANDFINLLVRNCDPNTADGEGLTSLHYACQYNRVNIIKILFEMVPKGNLTINARDKYGWTPMHCAIHHGNMLCLNLLIEQQADPNIKNAVGKSALHAAAARGRNDMVERLINHGGQINSQDNDGMTPLHEAAYRGHIECYKYLLQNPAYQVEDTIQDHLGYTAQDYINMLDH